MITEVTTTTYVAYQLSSDPNFITESIEQVEARDPQRQANEAFDSAFAFYYFDIVKAIIVIDGERITTTSSGRNMSSTYFIDAKPLTIDDLLALQGKDSVLLNNMRAYGWDVVARCRTGIYQPFDTDVSELIFTS